MNADNYSIMIFDTMKQYCVMTYRTYKIQLEVIRNHI